MATKRFDYDLIVIGSGAGGSAAATIAARQGLRVALIEEAKLGGDSVHHGDIPMRALLHVAHLYDEAKRGHRFGLRTTTLSHNYPSIRAWKHTVATRTGVHDDASFYEGQGITVIRGKAHFLTSHEITVSRRHISAAHFIIASGAEWKLPAIQGLKEAEPHTPRTILDFLRPPKRLAIIGSTRYGIEIAELFATFGTEVVVLEPRRRILPGFDKGVATFLQSSLSSQHGIQFVTDASVVSVQREGLTKRITFTRGGTKRQCIVDDIVVATEYLPRVDLGLGNAFVHYKTSGILTNRRLQTSVPHIYAIGDARGTTHDTHTTLAEARVAVHNIISKTKAEPDYTSSPRSILTTPEVAQVGITEAEARHRGLAYKKADVSLSMIGRSNVADSDDGYVSLLASADGTILGGIVVGPHASELIQEVVMAVRFRLSAVQIATTPHGFLSWSEAIRVAAQKISTSAIIKSIQE